MNDSIKVKDQQYILNINFEFLSNEQEAKYEALDFFDYHWNKPNKEIINDIHKQTRSSAFILTPKESDFIVISMGSSSTQAYHLHNGDIEIFTYSTGVKNLKENDLNYIIRDIEKVNKHVLFINAIGYGVPQNVHYLELPIDHSITLLNDESSNIIMNISNKLKDSQFEKVAVIVNSQIKPKIKNKWTNSLAQELKVQENEHSFFVDYGGGRFSIQHVKGYKIDDGFFNYKYDQEPIINYYKKGNVGIESTLLLNQKIILDAIQNYIEHESFQDFIKQSKFNIIIRQTGKLRELYYGGTEN